MADLDVSELFTDPDFTDPITVIQRTATVGENGKNIIVENCVSAIASVQSPNADTLKRLPEAARISGAKTFFTNTPVSADTNPGDYSDVIVWKCKRYQVINVFPWENWGAGWFKVEAIVEAPSI